MRLYFHLQNGTEMIRDGNGIEVADIHAAKAEALDAIAAIRGQQDTEPHYGSGWTLAVADGAGSLLFSLAVDAQI